MSEHFKSGDKVRLKAHPEALGEIQGVYSINVYVQWDGTQYLTIYKQTHIPIDDPATAKEPT